MLLYSFSVCYTPVKVNSGGGGGGFQAYDRGPSDDKGESDNSKS